MLATRRELEKLAAGRRDVSLLRGWRKEVVGETLVSGALTCGARAASRRFVVREALRTIARFLTAFLAAGLRLAVLTLRRATLRARALGAGFDAAFGGALPAGRAGGRRLGIEHVEQPLRDFFQRAFGVHGAQQTRVRVVRQHRLRLVGVDAQALGDSRFFVVLALEQLVLGRCRARSPSPGSAAARVWMLNALLHQRSSSSTGREMRTRQLLHRQLRSQRHHIGRRAEILSMSLVKPFGLRLRARERVEDGSKAEHQVLRETRSRVMSAACVAVRGPAAPSP